MRLPLLPLPKKPEVLPRIPVPILALTDIPATPIFTTPFDIPEGYGNVILFVKYIKGSSESLVLQVQFDSDSLVTGFGDESIGLADVNNVIVGKQPIIIKDEGTVRIPIETKDAAIKISYWGDGVLTDAKIAMSAVITP